MADKAVMETIANLRQSGLGNDEIKSMLVDIGFDEATINEAMSEGASEESSPIKEQEEIKPEIVNTVRDHANEAKLASNLAMNVAQAAGNKVDQHLERVNAFENRLDTLEDSISSLPTRDHIEEIKELHTNLNERHSDLQNKTDSIEAKIDGLTKLMKDILDNQRDILMRLR